MKNKLRWLTAWILYEFGEATYWLYCRLYYPSSIFKLYNRFMLWSADLQGETPYGPWRFDEENTER